MEYWQAEAEADKFLKAKAFKESLDYYKPALETIPRAEAVLKLIPKEE